MSPTSIISPDVDQSVVYLTVQLRRHVRPFATVARKPVVFDGNLVDVSIYGDDVFLYSGVSYITEKRRDE